MKKKSLAIFMAIATVLSPISLPLAFAEESQGGQPAVILNPGGGTTGTGMRLHFNSNEPTTLRNGSPSDTPGSDNVFFEGDSYWCCNGGGPVLSVGGQAFGEAGAADDEDLISWTTVAVSGQSGAFELVTTNTKDDPTSSATGNAGVTITYETTVSSLVYRVQREISYVYPNAFYDEDWTVVIPNTNTYSVNLYLGGDTSPGGVDQDGSGTLDVSRGGGLTAVYSTDISSGKFISYSARELASNFDYWFVGQYFNPYGAIALGNNLDNTVTTATHDAGMQVQWAFGSTPGSYTRLIRTSVGDNEDIGTELLTGQPDVQSSPASSVLQKQHVSTPNRTPSPGQTVKMFGAYFEGVTEVFVGGVQVQIISTAAHTLTIRMPRGLSGALDVELKSPLGTLLLPKHFTIGKLPTVGADGERLIIDGFAANSRKLTSRMKLRIDRWLESNSDLSTLTCTGFTSLPRRTSDVQLSTNRGKSACAYAKRQRPEITTSVSQGVEDPRPGSSVRRVRLVLGN